MDIEKIQEKMKNIPFGDSQFQIKNFIANEGTPERAFRKVLLQLNKKITAMKECEFRRRRRELDIREAEEKLQTARGIEAERLQVNIDEAEYYLENEIKLIEDCVIEIATYQAILNKLPDYTREDFEKAEGLYWKERLLLDSKHEIRSIGTVSKGTIDALHQMGIEIGRDEATGEFKYIESEPTMMIEK